jgi:hypothetical protein
MPTVGEYLDRLRTLVPARTLGFYLVANTLMMGLVDSADQLHSQYAWLILLVTGLALVFNFIGGLAIDKRPIVSVLLSSAALLLFMASQRFSGPLAAVGLDNKAAMVVVALVAAMFVALVPWLYKGELQGEAAASRRAAA